MQVIFRTEEEGHNCGRSYVSVFAVLCCVALCVCCVCCLTDFNEMRREQIFRSKKEDAEAWEEEVDEAVDSAKINFALQWLQEKYAHSTFELVRAHVRLAYERSAFQYLVAMLIVLGFVQDVLESCLQSEDEAVVSAFFWVEVCVTFFYTLELLCNMFVNSENCFRSFYSLPQNWVDFLVVIASLVSIILSLSESGHKVPIKMIRVVRVLNLAKFLKSFEVMHRMVSCLAYSAVPLINAFVLLIVVTIIWAVMGTDVLGERSPEFFGTFQSSLFSLFQVLSGDSWASQIAREMFVLDENGMRITDTALAFYFIRSAYTQRIVLSPPTDKRTRSRRTVQKSTSTHM